jgi:dTDP-4-dehydrorhamnose 3,5-epimerase
MKVIPSALRDLVVIEADSFADHRGSFMETWRRDRYRELGLNADFVQDCISLSYRGVIRGLHFQNPHPQAKIAFVIAGEVFDVAVDLRRSSPTFRQWAGMILSEKNRRQLFVPCGFAHGFCVLSETALFAYKLSGYYSPKGEHTIMWNDPSLGIDWPIKEPILSEKDRRGYTLENIPPSLLYE